MNHFEMLLEQTLDEKSVVTKSFIPKVKLQFGLNLTDTVDLATATFNILYVADKQSIHIKDILTWIEKQKL